MPDLLRTLLALATLAAAAASARAEGMVQLTLRGVTEEGGRVELEIGARNQGGETREVDLTMHVGPHTRAHDVVALLEMRLRRADFRVLAPAPDERRAHLFVEDVLFVRLRLGHGLMGTVTASEEAPSALRLVSPDAQAEPLELSFTATTLHPHSGERGQRSLEIELEGHESAAQISDRLFKLALANQWVAERPHSDSWRLVKSTDGALVQGLTVALKSWGDWRLELEFPADDGR